MKNYNILCLLVAGRGFVRSGNRDGIAKQGGASRGQCPLAARKTKAMVKTTALSPAKGRGICKERKARRNSVAERSVTRTMSPRRKKNKSHGKNCGFVTGQGEGICKERKARRNSEARRSVTRTMSPRRKKNKSHGENHGFVTGCGEGI